MTFIAVPIPVRDDLTSDQCLALARHAAAVGAQLVEWRVDGLSDPPAGAAKVQRLVEQSPLPSIVTCRSETEGGEFQGSLAELITLFTDVLSTQPPPRYLDVEWRMLRDRNRLRHVLHEAVERQPQPQRTSFILSSHDFAGRPADLLQRVEAMTTDDLGSVIKLAWRARSLRDNLEAFDLLRDRRKPTIALCLGQFGLLSRLLAPKFGGFITFAALNEGLESAPGQPLLKDLRKRYRFDSVGRDTRLFGVIGWPVEHSRSPDLHNAGFDAVGFDAIYVPLPIPVEYEHFKATVGALVDCRELDFAGASVTIPHKESLVRFVRERGGRLDATATRSEAANTLIVDAHDSIAAANTDAPAAIEAMVEAIGGDRSALKNKRVAVLGAGGVASAIVWGLVEAGCTVSIFNRSHLRAEHLAERVTSASTKGAGEVKVAGQHSLQQDHFDIYVNATPIGMEGGPAPMASPLPNDVRLDSSTIVFDTVYTPPRTPLIREAEVRGARVIRGEEMFLKQAALQFKAWTRHSAPMPVFRAALRTTGSDS